MAAATNHTVCIFPGTFDPITTGHIDIVSRACKVFDKVVVLLLINHNKKTMFSEEIRLAFAVKALAKFPQVTVTAFDGLLTEYCANVNCYNVVRGIRNGVDFEYEMQYFGINRLLCPQIEMYFLPTARHNLYVSSGNVRELLRHNGDVSGFVAKDIMSDVLAAPKDGV